MVVESRRYFAAEPRSVSLARTFTVVTLTDWGLDVAVEDVRLCVSELASNALVHGSAPGLHFGVRLAVVDDRLRVEVLDSRKSADSVCRSRPGGGDTRDTSGRGLAIVEAIADRWGVDAREPDGKITWACFKVAWAARRDT
ncbi:ATP-binding protein [Yinghuangia sp. ASG 101]|uniref:ATP-binding protein n=1 Tax=Yinghuangia sp. ASG 101 TaxID=2896848 RepID=UPI001E42C818|nr:ATP-binding protein [Yinghuangia sp. ASG 101]UGQ12722.1 ATP-binding protein [Yinghuangia sp. ASG 101]